MPGLRRINEEAVSYLPKGLVSLSEKKGMRTNLSVHEELLPTHITQKGTWTLSSPKGRMVKTPRSHGISQHKKALSYLKKKGYKFTHSHTTDDYTSYIHAPRLKHE